MCLFPGVGLNMQPMVPPTLAANQHKAKLYFVMLAHIILSIMYLFVNPFGGLSELITVLILWCAASQMNFCLLLFYIIMCGFSLVTNVARIGLWIQTNSLGEIFSESTFPALVIVFFTVFYPAAMYFAFQAYREFKGMMIDNGMGGSLPMPFRQGGGGGGGMNMAAPPREQQMEYTRLNQQPPAPTTSS